MNLTTQRVEAIPSQANSPQADIPKCNSGFSDERKCSRTIGRTDDDNELAASIDLLDWERIQSALGLSSREGQVVRSILMGLPEVRIAQELGISAHTVHEYAKRIHRKLLTRDKRELVIRIFLTHSRLA